MTIHELIKLRDEVRQLESDLKSAEREVTDLTIQLQIAEGELAAAQVSLQGARDHLAELTAMRDQIPSVEAEIESAQRESARLTAELSSLLDAMINRFREMVIEIRSRGVFIPPGLNQLEGALNELQASGLETRLARMPELITRLREILHNPMPISEIPQWLAEVSNFEGQVQNLNQWRHDAATRAQSARERLSELIARSAEISQAEANVKAGEAEAARLLRNVKGRHGALNAASARAEPIRTRFETLNQQYQLQLDGLIPGLNAKIPIALLPVRLETRFKGNELLVRIYPDDIQSRYARERADQR
jgi:chromosome segregation ATPase